MVAKRSARAERTQTINQARSLIVTGPDDLQAWFARHTEAALVTETAALRPSPGSTAGYATRIALRELGRRAEFLDGQLERLDELIVPLVTARAPGLLGLYGVGPDCRSPSAYLTADPAPLKPTTPGRLSHALWQSWLQSSPTQTGRWAGLPVLDRLGSRGGSWRGGRA